jgi:uncharacterized protein YceH (UPF0502 family)
MEPDTVEIRILGCLIEKQRTTPDAYPLSLNALRLACNQATNRDPVVDYDESVIRDALQHSYRRGWTRLASGHGSRAAKYRHLLDEALGLAPDELALLGVLMLRGPQTPGELKQRSERLHRFGDLAAVHGTLTRLMSRGHVAELPRRPGQKEERYVQLLGSDAPADGTTVTHTGMAAPSTRPAQEPPIHQQPAVATAPAPPAVTAPTPAPPAPTDPTLGARLAGVEREVAELRAELAALRDELGA